MAEQFGDMQVLGTLDVVGLVNFTTSTIKTLSTSTLTVGTAKIITLTASTINASIGTITTLTVGTISGNGAALTNLPNTISYIKVSNVLGNNTAGGTNIATSWATIAINTEDNDDGNYCSIGAGSIGTITLAAGTYEVDIVCPFNYTATAKLRLYNVTDATTTLLGQSCTINGASANYPAPLKGKFTIAVQKTFRIEYYTGAAYATVGLGGPTNAGVNEVYAIAVFRKTA